jgi:hypothetical protein
MLQLPLIPADTARRPFNRALHCALQRWTGYSPRVPQPPKSWIKAGSRRHGGFNQGRFAEAAAGNAAKR